MSLENAKRLLKHFEELGDEEAVEAQRKKIARYAPPPLPKPAKKVAKKSKA